jgi:hypothetical protein
MSTKLDIYPGTSLRLGVNSTSHDGALRRGIVSGLALDSDLLGNAVASALASVPTLSHPNVPGMSVESIEAQQDENLRPGCAFVSVRYGRAVQPRMPGTVPAQTVTQLSRCQRVTVPVKWYSSVSGLSAAGRPNGDPENYNVIGGNPNREPRPWYWRAPCVRILIPTVLSFHPGQDCASLVGTMNNAQITWMSTGWTMAAKTLYFVAPEVQAVVVGTGVSATLRYEVVYEFIWRRDTWEEEYVEWNVGTKAWDVHLGEQYPTATFTKQTTPAAGFPVHA